MSKRRQRVGNGDTFSSDCCFTIIPCATRRNLSVVPGPRLSSALLSQALTLTPTPFEHPLKTSPLPGVQSVQNRTKVCVQKGFGFVRFVRRKRTKSQPYSLSPTFSVLASSPRPAGATGSDLSRLPSWGQRKADPREIRRKAVRPPHGSPSSAQVESGSLEGEAGM